MAGMAGLEPANAGVKVPCLTAWRHPSICGAIGKKQGLDHLPIPCSCLGWVKGLEPSTPGTTIRCSNQLSYTHQIHGVLRPTGARRKMARQKGLEPLAYCLEGSCSIRLSYWRILERVTRIELAIPSLEGWCPGHCATPAYRAVARSTAANRQLANNNMKLQICQYLFPVFAKIFSAEVRRRGGSPLPPPQDFASADGGQHPNGLQLLRRKDRRVPVQNDQIRPLSRGQGPRSPSAWYCQAAPAVQSLKGLVHADPLPLVQRDAALGPPQGGAGRSLQGDPAEGPAYPGAG